MWQIVNETFTSMCNHCCKHITPRHRSMNLPPFKIMLSSHPLALQRTTIRRIYRLTPHQIHFFTTCEGGCYILQARLPYILLIMRQDGDKKIKWSKLRGNGEHDLNFCNVPLSFPARKHVSTERRSLKISGTENLATGLYNKLVPLETGSI